jgi:hypothetical protein
LFSGVYIYIYDDKKSEGVPLIASLTAPRTALQSSRSTQNNKPDLIHDKTHLNPTNLHATNFLHDYID